MRVYGDSIYGTSSSAFETLPWGRSTVKRRNGKTMVFLHVFEWPADGMLVVPGLGSDPVRAFLLGDSGSIRQRREGPNLNLLLSKKAPNADDTVIGLEFDGEPIIYEPPGIDAATDIFVETLAVRITARPGLEVHYTTDGTPPNAGSPLSTGLLTVDRNAVVSAQAFHKGRAVTPVVSRRFRKVPPRPSVVPTNLEAGLIAKVYAGRWDRLPDFGAMPPVSSFLMPGVSILGAMEGEAIGVRAEGYINVPSDEVYMFELTSDDGARLYVGGELVVDNDGLHSPEAKRGAIALATGCHTIRVDWFNKTGGTALRLRYATPGDGYNEVPVTWLTHTR